MGGPQPPGTAWEKRIWKVMKTTSSAEVFITELLFLCMHSSQCNQAASQSLPSHQLTNHAADSDKQEVMLGNCTCDGCSVRGDQWRLETWRGTDPGVSVRLWLTLRLHLIPARTEQTRRESDTTHNSNIHTQVEDQAGDEGLYLWMQVWITLSWPLSLSLSLSLCLSLSLLLRAMHLSPRRFRLNCWKLSLNTWAHTHTHTHTHTPKYALIFRCVCVCMWVTGVGACVLHVSSSQQQSTMSK